MRRFEISRRRSAYVCVSTVVLAVAGCGAGADEPRTTTTGIAGLPQLVTTDRVQSEQADSPERVFLSWWRAVQFTDVDSAQALVSEIGLQRIGGARGLRSVVIAVGGGLPNVTVIERRSTGRDRISLRVFVVSYDARGHVASRAPTSFSLTRRAGAWRLDDVTYLRRLARQRSAGR